MRAVRLDAAKPRDSEPLGPAVDDGFANDRHLALANARAPTADAGPDDAGADDVNDHGQYGIDAQELAAAGVRTDVSRVDK